MTIRYKLDKTLTQVEQKTICQSIRDFQGIDKQKNVLYADVFNIVGEVIVEIIVTDSFDMEDALLLGSKIAFAEAIYILELRKN